MQGSHRLAEVWAPLVELPDLPVGTPAEIAVARIPEVRVGDRLEATACVEPGRAFVGEGLVLDEPVLACQPNGLLVEALGVQLTPCEAGDLGRDQRGAIREILRAALRPPRELGMVRDD